MIHNDLQPFPSPLPHDVLLAFRDYLSHYQHHATAARLLPCNKLFYDLFIPVIDYTSLTIHKYNGHQIFWGLSGQPSSDPRSSASSHDLTRKRRKFHNEPGRSKHYPRPNSQTHHRKLALLRQTRCLTIVDLQGLRACSEAHEASGEPLFSLITHMSLSTDVVNILSNGYLISSRNLSQQFQEIFQPTHLCIHTSIPNKEEWITQLAGKKDLGDVRIAQDPEDVWMAEDYEDAWEYSLKEDLTHFVESCSKAWKGKSLTSLTIHGLSAQNIPAVESEHTSHRYFFDIGLPYEDIPMPITHGDVCVMKRSRDIADVISMLGPPDESRFEFVDVDCVICGEGRETVEGLVWGQISQKYVRDAVKDQVRFLRRDEVEGCICCGEQ